MPNGKQLSLFLSSTCYDLSQIRADLKHFIESIGHQPILSEYNTFPVNPDQNTLNNCLEIVRDKTDIFILIVGGRYGSMTETGKSITNLEFVEASANGIPKYIFIKENILALFPVWKDNPEADFSSTVDTSMLFQFVAELTESGDTWVFPFSYAQDIIDVLKRQLSYLFSESLDLRKKYISSESSISELHSKALRIAIEKPVGWEYLLFAQIIRDNFKDLDSKRLDSELGISFGDPIVLNSKHEIASWLRTTFRQISLTIEQITNAINFGYVRAVGTRNEEGNIDRILHLANRIADGYESLLDWKLQFLRVTVDKEFEKLLFLASEFSSNAITELEKFSSSLYDTLEFHIENENSYDDGTIINITLTFNPPDEKAFYDEFKKFQRNIR